jgi:hypothetical protein
MKMEGRDMIVLKRQLKSLSLSSKVYLLIHIKKATQATMLRLLLELLP